MRARVGVVAALLIVLSTLLAGCGSASAPSPPSGVDELVIPTPTPDPDDFVARVDNPWLPLTVGRRWTYDVADDRGTHALVVTVAAGPEIAGVATTARMSTEVGRTTTDWFAQDTRGNVWWLGREGRWRTGERGARAGVAMLAHPRVGDGYRTAYSAGIVEDTVQVLALDASETLPVGRYDDLLEVARRSVLVSGSVTQLFARGVGLVQESAVAADQRTVRLRSVSG